MTLPFDYAMPSEHDKLYECKKLSEESIVNLDIQPKDWVKIKPYCGFLPSFSLSFTYDEKYVYSVKDIGITDGNMLVYSVEDAYGHLSKIPHCYLELVQKGDKSRFVLDSKADPNGIIIRDGVTSKAILHANKISAANARIDVASLMLSLCEMLNTSMHGTTCNIQANPQYASKPSI